MYLVVLLISKKEILPLAGRDEWNLRHTATFFSYKAIHQCTIAVRYLGISCIYSIGKERNILIGMLILTVGEIQ